MKYKVGDKVRIKSLDWYNENKDEFGDVKCSLNCSLTKAMSIHCGSIQTIESVVDGGMYWMKENPFNWADEMIEELVEEEEVKDMGEVSDGYHTFNELYEYRLLYNASMFNELAKQNLYNVHKSKRHSDGEIPFGDSNWFIVMAELPTGQISNHYEMKDWDLFQIPEKETANKWDGHTPKDVTERLRRFLTPKPKYPKTYEECCEVLSIAPYYNLKYHTLEHDYHELATSNKLLLLQGKLNILGKLLICKDAYWKIAGEEMGLDKPWEPDWNNDSQFKYIIICRRDNVNKDTYTAKNCILAFPTEEMRDAFCEAFKEEIEICKELL